MASRSRSLLVRGLRQWFKGMGRGTPLRRRPARPQLEVLERRDTPSAPFLVNEINPAEATANPTDFTNLNGTLFFNANDGGHGYELWRSNGNSADTVLVKDIFPGLAHSNPQDLTTVGGTLFFSANDGSRGFELWKSDGTSAGTTLVKDIHLGSAGSSPFYLTNVSGTLFFMANDGSHGTELWTSDGTSAGTVLVKDIRPGPGPAVSTAGRSLLAAYNPANVNGTLFFSANDGSHGFELWTSNGTSAGTVLVSDINPGSAGSKPAYLANIGGTLFFAANDGSHGTELWTSNGTSAGTLLVKDLNPGSGSAIRIAPYIGPFGYGGAGSSLPANVNGVLFFAANDGSHGYELCQSNGTSTGTVLVSDIRPGSADSSPHDLINVSGTLFFAANDGSHGYELWQSNGTSAGTTLVKDINPGSRNMAHPRYVSPANLNGTLFFRAFDGSYGRELWKSDGTSAGTVLVKDLWAGSLSSYPYRLTNVGGTLFFAGDDGLHLNDVFRSDGTSSGTVLVNDINTYSANANPNGLTNVNGTVFFTAAESSHGKELWRSDGTSTGTVLVNDIKPGQPAGVENYFSYHGHSNYNGAANVNGTLFFCANDNSHGYELWKSDGTSAGTLLVKDIHSGSLSSRPQDLINVSGTLFFSANDGSHGYELWQSDGSSSGTTLVNEINPGSAGGTPARPDLTNVNGTLFFVATDGSHGNELWKFDSTSNGTTLVKDVNPGSAGSSPRTLTNVGGTLFFSATDGSHGYELWMSDGTSAGTTLVKDIRPGSADASPSNLTNVGGTLLFAANDGSHGTELWQSNGTSTGTVLVKDIRPGATSSSLSNLTNVGGTLFFAANDGSHGTELWQSNGTSAGTTLVNDSNPGSNNSSPRDLVNISGTLFFTADDGSHGIELWQSNGTSAGTYLVADIFSGSNGSNPHDLVNVSGGLFFDASDGAHGTELWGLVTPVLTGLSPSTTAEGSAPFTLTVTGTFFDSTATVLWNGIPLTTQFDSATQLEAAVPASLVAEEGSATVSVTEDKGSSGGLPFTISDAPLGSLTIHAPSAIEGISTGSFTVASFTDANSGAPATDFTATIDWGDGSPHSTASIVASATPGVFDVVVSGHTYAEEGDQSLSVQILDIGGASVGGSLTITVADAPLSVSVQAPPVSEGVDSFQIRVATFHDGNPLAPASDFTAVIAWGDGSTSTVTSADNSIRSLGGGDFAVWSRHTYTAEEGNVTLSVQVTDNGGASATASRSIPIADALLSSLSIKSLGVVEGVGKSGMTVATFHDANTLAPATDFTATISWGDGGTSTVSGADGSIVALGGGNFALLSSHTYAEEGAYALAVQILDIGGASLSGSRAIPVADASLTGLSLQNPRASEGISTSTFTVATFRDGNTAAPATDFTATISWGDGGTSTVSGADGSIVALGGGNFALLSSHTYAEEGTKTLSVQVLDQGGASTTGTLRISVADAPLSSLVVQDPGATEGSGTGTFTVATFHDGNLAAPASDFTARVTWGDGSTTTVSGAGIVSLGGGDFAVLSSHTYADEGTYTLAVQITDVGGALVTGNRTIAVADAALSSLVLNNPDATEGIGTGTFTLATFSDANTVAPATDFTAVVQWGDGSTTTVAPAGFVRLAAGSFALLSSHTYAEEGTYSLSVQVLDKGGASVSGALTVSVADAPLSVSVQVPPATEGVDPGNVRVAIFHDANTLAPASDFTAVIAWGDGSTSTVTAADNSIRSLGGGDFAVWARHAYTAEEGVVTLSVQVTDRGGASASGSRSIPVADAMLSGLNIFHLGATEGIGKGTITVATFHDGNLWAPATDFTATISWGDGGTSTVSGADGSIVALGGGNFALLSSHTYAEEGIRTLSVQILDIGGASLSGSRAIPVADAALTSLVVTAPPAVAGIPTGTFTVATFHDANLAAPVTDFTATIGWGDGGTTTVTSGSGGLVSLGGGDFAVLAEHTYAVSGPVTLSVRVADVGGPSLTRSSTFSVSRGTLAVGRSTPPVGSSPAPEQQLLVDLAFMDLLSVAGLATPEEEAAAALVLGSLVSHSNPITAGVDIASLTWWSSFRGPLSGSG